MRRHWILLLLVLALPFELVGSQPLARLLVATSAGPYVSFSWGEYWETLRHRLPLDARVFYCLGPRAYAGGPGGLFVSDDFGDFWREAGNWEGGAVTGILASSYFPAEPVIFVGSADGLWVSRNAGESWERSGGTTIRGPVNAMIWAGPVLFVATARGLFQSVDAGFEWARLGEDLPEASVLSIETSSYFPAEAVMFVGLENGGIYRSRDAGEHFEAVSEEDWAGRSVRAIEWWHASLFVGTDAGLFLSQDAGETWTSASAELRGKKISAISIPAAESNLGSDILLGTEQGVFKSSDGATTWREANEGMSASTIYAFGSFPIPPEPLDMRGR